jgi:hypothetical protein
MESVSSHPIQPLRGNQDPVVDIALDRVWQARNGRQGSRLESAGCCSACLLSDARSSRSPGLARLAETRRESCATTATGSSDLVDRHVANPRRRFARAVFRGNGGRVCRRRGDGAGGVRDRPCHSGRQVGCAPDPFAEGVAPGSRALMPTHLGVRPVARLKPPRFPKRTAHG